MAQKRSGRANVCSLQVPKGDLQSRDSHIIALQPKHSNRRHQRSKASAHGCRMVAVLVDVKGVWSRDVHLSWSVHSLHMLAHFTTCHSLHLRLSGSREALSCMSAAAASLQCMVSAESHVCSAVSSIAAGSAVQVSWTRCSPGALQGQGQTLPPFSWGAWQVELRLLQSVSTKPFC